MKKIVLAILLASSFGAHASAESAKKAAANMQKSSAAFTCSAILNIANTSFAESVDINAIEKVKYPDFYYNDDQKDLFDYGAKNALANTPGLSQADLAVLFALEYSSIDSSVNEDNPYTSDETKARAYYSKQYKKLMGLYREKNCSMILELAKANK